MIIGDLVKLSRELDKHKIDYGPLPVRSISFSETNMGIVIPPSLDGAVKGNNDETVLPMTTHAMSQVCRKLGSVLWPESTRSLPMSFLNSLPADHCARVLNWIKRNSGDDDGWTVRTSNGICRAILSKDYSVVDNTRTLEMVRAILEDERRKYTIDRYSLTEDTLHLRLSMMGADLGQDHVYQRGVFVRNGEIGNSSVSVWPWVKKISCENSFAWEGGGWSHIHMGNQRLIAGEFAVHFARAFNRTGELLNRLVSSHNVEVTLNKTDTVMRGWRWTESIRDEVYSNMNAWTLGEWANAISLVAHNQNEEDRLAMEIKAGNMLFSLN